jgi:parallel beta-helix repeat protein
MPNPIVNRRAEIGSGVKPIFSVMRYGAVGDGTTNDTTAVQNCLNAAGAAKGICYFPAGTYSTGHLTFPANVTVQGPPTSGNPRPTAWTAELISRTGYSNNFVNIVGANVTVKWMSFNGNRATCTSNGLLYGQTNVNNVTIDSCYLHNSLIEGIENNGSANWIIQNCTFDDNDYAVMLLSATTTNCLIQNNLITNTRATSIDASLNAFNGAHDNIFLNNYIDGTSGSIYFGCNINASPSNTVRGNTFINCKNGIYVQAAGATNTIVDGNTITAGAFSAGAGITVTATTGAGTQIINNTVTNWTANYPIIVIANSAKVNGNTVTGSSRVEIDATNPGEVKNNIISSATAIGLYLKGNFNGVEISGNTIHHCQGNGIHVYGDIVSCLFQNNVCYDNGMDGANNKAGIMCPYVVVTCSFVGNHCYDDQGTKKQKWGISIANGSSGTYTSDNDMTGNISNPVWDGLTAV